MIDYDIYHDDIIDVLNDEDIPGVALVEYEMRDGKRPIIVHMFEQGVSEEWREEIVDVCREFGEYDIKFEYID